MESESEVFFDAENSFHEDFQQLKVKSQDSTDSKVLHHSHNKSNPLISSNNKPRLSLAASRSITGNMKHQVNSI